MDAALQAELLALFIGVLAEVRASAKVGLDIYVCLKIDRACTNDSSDGLFDAAHALWYDAGNDYDANTDNCGWWSQTPHGHAQRILALESIIRDLGGDPQ